MGWSMDRARAGRVGHWLVVLSLLPLACEDASTWEDGDPTEDEADEETDGALDDTFGDGLATPAPQPQPDLEPDSILGVGISHPSGYAYAWTAADTVSAGIPAQLTSHRSPYRWSDSVASTPIDMAIASTGVTYVWYANGKLGKGSDTDPTQTIYDYVLPGGRTPSSIAGMAILKSNNRTHAYYLDGTYSTGTTATPGSTSCCSAYALPPGKSASAIVGMDFDKNSRLYTWFDDGTYTVGTASDLDFHAGPRRYARHGMLASVYNGGDLGPPADWPPAQVPPNPGPAQIAPSADTFTIEDLGSNDLLVAAGRDALGLAFNASVRFYDKDGDALAGGSLDDAGDLRLQTMFAEFVRKAPPTTDNPNDVNHYMGFAQACDDPSLPATDGYKYCVSSSPYDTRVHYDQEGDRWVVLAALRNRVFTNYFANKYYNSALSDAELYEMPFDEEEGFHNCGLFAPPSGPSVSVPEGAHCKEARRLLAVAVSQTSDPTKGWFTYVFVENNYRDWPWMAVDGDWIIASHAGVDDPGGPVSTLISLADMRKGEPRPQYVNYYASDLAGYVRADPPQQYGSLPNHSLVVGEVGDDLGFFVLPHPDLPYAKRAAGIHVEEIDDVRNVQLEQSAYRHGNLYLVSALDDEDTHPIRVARIPLSVDADQPYIATSGGDFLVEDLTAPVPDIHRLDTPVLAVNGVDHVFMTWGIDGMKQSDGVMSSVGHSIWRPGAPWFDETRIFYLGYQVMNEFHEDVLKAQAVAVDPVDDRTFWGAHMYGTLDGKWGIVVGSVDPADPP
jgi:hypothetical protein